MAVLGLLVVFTFFAAIFVLIYWQGSQNCSPRHRSIQQKQTVVRLSLEGQPKDFMSFEVYAEPSIHPQARRMGMHFIDFYSLMHTRQNSGRR